MKKTCCSAHLVLDIDACIFIKRPEYQLVVLYS